MNGLNNIISKINEETELSVKEILDNAKKRADEITSDAVTRAEAIKAEMLESAKSKCDVTLSKSASTSLLEYKRILLSTKAQIVDSAIKSAIDDLCNAPDDIYFSRIEELIKKHALCESGEIFFNARDLERLPAGFKENLSSLVGDKGSISISKTATDCDGGFIIEYPKARIDCTFSSLALDKDDDIRDIISKSLFA